MTTRFIIFGSRNWTDKHAIDRRILCLLELYPDLLIVHGDCPTGADAIAQEVCELLKIPTERHPADWAHYGRAAGPRRNAQVAELGAAGAFGFSSQPRPYTPGTRNMHENCFKRGISTLVTEAPRTRPVHTGPGIPRP